ncbi:MAG: hypothetical protein GY953_50360, partial [bacterium]|nr:hypothetical protein [bacterium]
MSVIDILKQFVIAIIIGLFWWPDDEDLKPERIQWWLEAIHPDWRQEGKGTALLRTIMSSDTRAATGMVQTLTDELGQHGYKLEAETAGSMVNLRLTTASVGRITERDYAAALLPDLTLSPHRGCRPRR